jgi:outer membrane protein OmpA-like peptidoglycan-associated protein
VAERCARSGNPGSGNPITPTPDAEPLGLTQGVLILDDFPRHTTQLDPSQRDKLRRLAQDLVGALAKRDVAISIHGHADFDGKGRDFEIKVSRERARAAEAELSPLLEDVAARAGVPTARLQSIQWLVFANGTANPRHPKPGGPNAARHSRENRRVELVWSVTPTSAPVQSSVFTRCLKVLDGSAAPGPARRLTCICSKLQQTSPRVSDATYDFRRSRNMILGSVPPKQWDVALRTRVWHSKERIQWSSSRMTSDGDFRAALTAMDDSIGQNISDFQAPTPAGSPRGIFDRIILSDMADSNHVYSCYAGYSRHMHDQ